MFLAYSIIQGPRNLGGWRVNPLDFGRLVNTIPTRRGWGRLCPPHYYPRRPRFSDLPTGLSYQTIKIDHQRCQNSYYFLTRSQYDASYWQSPHNSVLCFVVSCLSLTIFELFFLDQFFALMFLDTKLGLCDMNYVIVISISNNF